MVINKLVTVILLEGSISLPSYWQLPLDTYQEHLLVPATAEYTKVEDNFMKSLGAGGNGVLEVSDLIYWTLFVFSHLKLSCYNHHLLTRIYMYFDCIA